MNGGNVIEGNFIGTDPAGNLPRGNPAGGVYVFSGSGNTIGGTTAAARNVISANSGGGVYFFIHFTSENVTANNVLQNNYIGTNAAGTAALSNDGGGVYIISTVGNRVLDNLISGNSGGGLFIVDNVVSGPALNNLVRGNRIGMEAGNTFSLDNDGGGVFVDGVGSTGNAIRATSVFGNRGGAIFIGNSGVSTTIQGTLSSAASNYRVEFFASDSCDAGGRGEGHSFLGQAAVNTNSTGRGAFSLTSPTAVPLGRVITATATDPAGNTSEFSQCFTMLADDDNDAVANIVEQTAPNGGDANNDGTPDSQQTNVSSLPNDADGSYVTLTAPAGTTLSGVQALANPSPADAPPNANFPLGFVEFTLLGVAPGGAATVEFNLPPGASANTYVKYGPTADNPTPHFYECLFDGTTGAELFDDNSDGSTDRIVLHFMDGQRGDDDLAANGIIVDPGAPAAKAGPKVTASQLTLDAARRSVAGALLTFDQSFTAATASNTGNYAARLAGKDKKFNTRDDVAVPIRSANYNDALRTVTLLLSPAKPIKLGTFVQVTAKGSTTPGAATVTSSTGVPLDGDSSGIPGGDFIAALGIGTKLSYTDSNGDLVSLTLTRGGVLELTLPASPGGNPRLQFSGVFAGSSTLSGSVKKPRTGGDGRTSLAAITGSAGVSLFALSRCSPTVTSSCFEIGTIAAALVDRVLENGLNH